MEEQKHSKLLVGDSNSSRCAIFMPRGNEEQPSQAATGVRILHQYVVISGVVCTRREWKECIERGEDTEGYVPSSILEES